MGYMSCSDLFEVIANAQILPNDDFPSYLAWLLLDWYIFCLKLKNQIKSGPNAKKLAEIDVLLANHCTFWDYLYLSSLMHAIFKME